MEAVDVMLGGVRERTNEEIASAISRMTPAEVDEFWAKAGAWKRQQVGDHRTDNRLLRHCSNLTATCKHRVQTRFRPCTPQLLQYEEYARQYPNARFSGPNMTADAHVEDLQAELAHIGKVDWQSMRKPVNSLEDAKERARIANDGVEKARLRHQKSLLALKQARMLERKAHQETAMDYEEEVCSSNVSCAT